VIKNHNKKTFLFLFLLPALIIVANSNVLNAQITTAKDTLSQSFYDTLRVRSENHKVTRFLYDFLIVSPGSGESTRKRLSSTKPFDSFEGLTIRNTQFLRLNAFGSNIDNPLVYDPTRGEKFLNATYIKTRNFVLQKYLLFKKGDKLSPLVLSDNERLFRDIPFIEDARIIVVPVSDTEADIMVIIRESYPLGFNVTFKQISQGKAEFFDKNFAGIGHELEINFPFEFKNYSYPGIGAAYSIKNIYHSFSDLTFNISDGLGATTAGTSLSRPFVSSGTKYAGYAAISRTYTSEDLDTMDVAAPLRYTYQDYWLARSFMLDKKSVTRLIVSLRHINNNVYTRPEITGNSFYPLQRYKMFIGSVAVSSQKFYNTSLIYGYGRTEDIPYGYLLEADAGMENNEFKKRSYIGFEGAYGTLLDGIGYLYCGAGFATFYNKGHTEQGLFQARMKYFTPLIRVGKYKMRNFLDISYIRGFNRYTNEFLWINSSTLIRGFISDSLHADHRLIASIEPVIFSPQTVLGFRYAIFAFADAGITVLGRLDDGEKTNIYAFGLGIRLRNDQLLFNTIQIRIGYYPVMPEYSRAAWFNVDGLKRLKPPNFEPGAPAVIPYL